MLGRWLVATARCLVVAEGEVAAYHCIARCVRRAYLCGADPLTGRSFDHRRAWVRERLELLAGYFAVDVGGYAAMANHVHVVLKSRPDVAAAWSAKEITERWRAIFKPRGLDAKTLKAKIDVEAADGKLVTTRRQRLASVSWFMRCLCEPIARRANREDDCKGRFWEGRFHCVALLDDAAILACTAYVDLNPVRAGIAKTPENSAYTSVHDRVTQSRPSPSEAKATDGWLAPIAPKAKRSPARRRASQTPWIALALDDYLKLLDWTGRQVRSDKRGSIPMDLLPILERLKVKPSGWLQCAQHFGKLFKRAAGSPSKLAERARRNHYARTPGAAHCRTAFT